MKRLKKILLMNWLYFSKQVIELDDINFLTGKTGAGKSTIIDALQIVLLGELNERNFNKAANEHSQRTLDGYLRTDLDAKNPKSRRGRNFTSYIACEYHDDRKDAHFVSGIVFDCHADGSRQERFFLYDGVIPAHCFTVNQIPMDISRLNLFIKESADVVGKLYNTHKEYRETLLAKWNVHKEQAFQMLKKAVSFQPIVDIQKFITENVCDIPERPDIEAMQQSIRDYQRHEELAQRQEAKLARLSEIALRYQEMRTAIDRLEVCRFVTLWAEKEDAAKRMKRSQENAAGYAERVKAIQDECEQIEREKAQKDKRKSQLTADSHNSDVYKERERLESDIGRLESERRQIADRLRASAQKLKHESQIWRAYCERIQDCPEREELRLMADAAHELWRAWLPFADSGEDIFTVSGVDFEQIREATKKFASALRNADIFTSGFLNQCRAEKERAERALTSLRRNQKDYPDRLLSFRQELRDGLERRFGRPVPVEILADTLEIADGQERWREAIEGYLHTQKFYLLVPADCYNETALIYDNIKRRYEGFGLADIGKLRERERLEAFKNSLAEKIETDNDLARSYVNYRLGRVMACERVEQLHEYATAITPEGMLYQGYVLRAIPRERMRNAFIGQKSIASQIESREKERKEAESQIAQWAPTAERISEFERMEPPITNDYLQNELPPRRQDCQRRIEIQEELSSLEEAMSHLNLTWLAEMKSQIAKLEEQIKEADKRKEAAVEQRGKLQEKIRNIEEVELPALRNELATKEAEITRQFSAEFQKGIGLPRYEQEISRRKNAGKIAAEFRERLPQIVSEAENAKSGLFQAREGYVRDFQPCPFRVRAMDNDEFSEEERRLREIELPQYRDKIRTARESAMEQFQNDFLARISESIQQVQKQVGDLNRVLRNGQFGTDRYRFIVRPNPDYADYYAMIQDFLGCDGGVFALPLQQKYGPLIEELFGRIATADDDNLNARKREDLERNIRTYTDFRTYLQFDLETTDQNGNRQMLSKTLNMKSGGETQTPFYIAVLASFAQLYQVHNLNSVANNTVRLVVFDEAFNKMDSERIAESVRLLRKMNLQAIISTPPDKIADIAPLADCALLVGKQNYQMSVLPWRKERADA